MHGDGSGIVATTFSIVRYENRSKGRPMGFQLFARGREIAARQCLPTVFAEGVSYDAFLRLRLQVTFTRQFLQHLRRLIHGERGPHRGRGRGELVASI
jgi:hypothetical protein